MGRKSICNPTRSGIVTDWKSKAPIFHWVNARDLETHESRTFTLFHVGWLVGGDPLGSVRFELRELNTVSVDKNSFDGTYDQKFFDANGNLVFEDTGTIHATRLSVSDY